jgi:hypothetical protein
MDGQQHEKDREGHGEGKVVRKERSSRWKNEKEECVCVFFVL